MKYLKKFETHNDYESYIENEENSLPILGYCKNVEDVHLATIPVDIIGKFNVPTGNGTYGSGLYGEGIIDGSTIKIFNKNISTNTADFLFKSIIIDNNEIDFNDLIDDCKYTLSSGEHIIKYILNEENKHDNTSTDSSTVYNALFTSIPTLTSVEILDETDTLNNVLPNYFFVNCNSLNYISLNNKINVLGGNAFLNTAINTIYLPESINYIESQCFANTPLTKIEIPKNVSILRAYLFSGCNNLSEIKLNEGLTELWGGCFNNLPGIESLEIPDSVTRIDAGAINLPNLKHLKLPNNLTELASGTLYPNKIEYLEIPDSVTIMNSGCIYGCTKLKYLKLSKNLTSLQAGVVQSGMADLETIYIPADSVMTRIESGAFSGCNKLKYINLPESLNYIGAYAFTSANLETINIPGNVSTLLSQAFICPKLKNVILNEGLERIETNAFYNCSSLTDINIPESVTKIGDSAFTNVKNFILPKQCSSIGSLNSSTITINYLSIENDDPSVYFISKKIKTLRVNSKNFSQPTIQGCYIDTLIFDSSIENISITNQFYPYDIIFKDSSVLKNIYIGPLSPLQYIKQLNINAPNLENLYINFSGYQSILETVNIISSSLNIINYGMFSYCYNLKSVILPDSVTDISTEAFYNCTGLKYIKLPNNLKIIRKNAFNSCKLTELFLPSTLETIEYSAFAYNSSLKTIEIPDGFKNCSDGIFRNSFYISNISIGIIDASNCLGMLRDIGSGASIVDRMFINSSIITNYFDNNNTLKQKIDNLIIGENVQIIGKDAFYYVPIRNVSFMSNNNLKIIGERAFDFPTGRNLLTDDIILPNSVELIGFCSFWNVSTNKIVIGENIKNISDGAFQSSNSVYNQKIRNIVINASIPPTLEGAQVFKNDTSIYVLDDYVDTYKTSGYFVNVSTQIYPKSIFE